jgi:hypothetical protein
MLARGRKLGLGAGASSRSGQPVPQVLSFSTIPHLVWGFGLGVVAGYGFRGPVGVSRCG